MSGLGSRGGKVVGYTERGEPIYESHKPKPKHTDTHGPHRSVEAQKKIEETRRMWALINKYHPAKKSGGDMDIFKSLGITVGEPPSLVNSAPTRAVPQQEAHSSQVVRKGFSGNPRDRLEEQLGLSKGSVGIPITTITQIPIDTVERTKIVDKKKPEYLRDLNGESFHTDNDKQVEDFLSSEEEIVERSLSQEELFIKGTDKAFKLSVNKGAKLPPKPGHIRKPEKDPVQAKQERDQRRSMGIKSVSKSARNMSVEDSLDSLISFGEDPYANRPEMLTNVHENSGGVIERLRPAQLQKSSELDELCDIFKGEKMISTPKKEMVQEHKKLVGVLNSPSHADDKKEAKKQGAELQEYRKKSFVKSSGPGGMVFDFGHLTGNRIADEATALLNQFGDPVQMASAQYQDSSYKKALSDFSTKGEAAYMGETTPFGNINKDNAKMLGKSFDQQVQDEYDQGKLYQDRSAPAVKNDFNKTEITLGGQVIKATSETDAALIKMMQSQEVQGDPNGMAIDATNGGKISVTAGG